jgi:hypothetical protein
MGFGIDTGNCKVCGVGIYRNHAVNKADDRYILDVESGALVCKKCASLRGNGRVNIDNYVNGYVIGFIDETNDGLPRNQQNNEHLRITELLLLYCRRHLDIRNQLNSFEFVKSILLTCSNYRNCGF